MTSFVTASGLYKSFWRAGTEIEVLRNIDLEIGQGERVAIVGPSGAGKSTLLHILGALDRPTLGSVQIDGVEIFERSDKELAKLRNSRIGFVFQFHHLLPEFTAVENTSMPARIAGMPAAKATGLAQELLEAVGLSHRFEHRPSQLSGGEQQRVALARALVCKPKLLLADEPTGNLDRTTGSQVHQLMIDMNRRFDVTLVVATHNPELAGHMDRVITIEDGRIVADEAK